MSQETKQGIGKQKIMFIVWKWNPLEAINEKSFEKRTLQSYIDEIGATSIDSKFYREYLAEQSRLCPDAKIVASYIYNTSETLPLLVALLNYYATNEAEVMVFLHRGDNYNEEEVKYLLQTFNKRIINCFLFADGRDFIYHKTQGSGFLDDAGGFRNGKDRKTGELISTFKDGLVRQPYFDRVWSYYTMEFESKVYQLKEELFEAWFPLLLPANTALVQRESLIETIKNHERLLWIRLRSFVGLYIHRYNLEDDDETDDEEWRLTQLEKKMKTSLVFDDCIQNLEHFRQKNENFVLNEYNKVKKQLKELLFNENPPQVSFTKEQIRNLADDFNYLVKVIPGEMD